MSDETSAVVTTNDVEELNRATIRRLGYFAQMAGAVLLVIGAVGVAAWLWLVVRQQLRAGDGVGGFSFDGDPGRPTIAGRIDMVMGATGLLVEGALAAATGIAIRLLGGVLRARAGASLTGFEPGDPFPEETPG